MYAGFRQRSRLRRRSGFRQLPVGDVTTPILAGGGGSKIGPEDGCKRARHDSRKELAPLTTPFATLMTGLFPPEPGLLPSMSRYGHRGRSVVEGDLTDVNAGWQRRGAHADRASRWRVVIVRARINTRGPVTFNQSPPPAVCAVGALKEKPVPVTGDSYGLRQRLEPTGIVKLTLGTC